MNKIGNLLWGLVFIIVGVIFGLNALNITHINLFFDGWWTLFIIVPCFIGLFKDEDKSGNLIGLIIGICLLLGCKDILEFDLIWKLMVPVILVMIGLSFIFKDALGGKINNEIKKINSKGNKENSYCATFSGQNINFDKEKFTGSDINAIFGSVKLDLRKAIIDDDIVINASSIFGGIDIFVPEKVNIKVKSTAIFGGVENKKNTKEEKKCPTIYINAIVLFGGVKIND